MRLTLKDENKPIIFSIFGNIILAIIKIVVGYLYNSIGVIADGIHSLSDVFTSIIGYIGIAISSKPEDENHPHGHKRYESLFSLFMGLLLFYAVYEILAMSINKILHNSSVEVNSIVIGVLILSIVFKEVMTQYSLYIGKKLNNYILIADAYHHRSDVYSSIIVLLGILLEKIGIKYADAVAGIIVSLMIAKIAAEICKESIDQLTGKSPPKEVLEKIKEEILKFDNVKGVHNLKAHYVGPLIYVEAHVEVDGKNMSAKELHDLEEKIKNRLESLEKIGKAYIHIDVE